MVFEEIFSDKDNVRCEGKTFDIRIRNSAVPSSHNNLLLFGEKKLFENIETGRL